MSALSLLKPKFLGFKNTLFKSTLSSRRSQAIAVGIFSLVMMAALYLGTRWGLKRLNEIPLLVYVPPSLPLGLMLIMLLLMTSITALASALGTFYLSDDLETILASPTSSLSFFAARLSYVVLTVGWMPFVFIFPVLAAMAATYHLTPWFIPCVVLTLLPYFLIPASLGVLIAMVFMTTINQRWTKLLIRIGIGFGIIATLYVAQNLLVALIRSDGEGQALRFTSMLSFAQSPCLPSAWAAGIISELLAPTGRSVFVRLSLLYSCALGITAVAHIALHFLHAQGFSRALSRKAQTGNLARGNNSRLLRDRSAPLAIIDKDLRSLLRDVAQSTQLVFLGGLSLLYLLNLKNFIAVSSLTSGAGPKWQGAFFTIHSAITAFFTSAVCTRLVFTALSLEGKSFWILQTAPMRFRSVLTAKFFGWFVPIAIVSGILFSVGTHILVGRWEITILFTVLSFFISYGIVGLGIGLGAYFADFSWEHPSQLALSVGGFIFMLSSGALIFLNIVPLGFLLRLMLSPNSSPLLYCEMVATTLVITLLNMGTARLALRLGEGANLER